MSTWYISPLLSPGHASSVLGIGLRRAEGFEQFPQFLIVGTAKAHGEVRAQRCGQQTESVLSQVADSWQLDSTEGREPAAEQIIKRRVKNREDRDAQQWLPVK